MSRDNRDTYAEVLRAQRVRRAKLRAEGEPLAVGPAMVKVAKASSSAPIPE